MKKLLGISVLALILSACSQSDTQPQPPQGPGLIGGNPEVEKALQECQQEVGQTQDQAKFDACMQQKGFERPSGNPPQGQPPAAPQTN